MNRWHGLAMMGLMGLTWAGLQGRTATADEKQTPPPQSAVSRAQVQRAVDQLVKLAETTRQEMQLPGLAVAVIHGDDVLLLRGFGVRTAGQPEPIDAETVFQLASVSKPLTATILAKLVGQQRLSWDDRICDLDSGFQLSEPWVTRELRIRDLLSHRSGLPDHAGDLLEDLGYPRSEVLHRLRLLTPEYSFRAGYAYTNFGFSQAAYAAALTQKQTWEDLADREFFQPLGMQHTSFRHADFAKHENRARLHVQVDGKWQAKYDRQPDGQAPAGGASASLRDVVVWLQLLLNDGQHQGKEFVSAAALDDTHQPHSTVHLQTADGRLNSYGLGWLVGVERGQRTTWKHSGAFAMGARTEVAVLPAEKLAIAVLCNSAPHGVPEGLTESFLDLALDGRLERDWITLANQKFAEMVQEELTAKSDYSQPPRNPQPPLPLAEYVGVYDHDFYGPATIVLKDDTLHLQLGPQPLSFSLKHWDRDLFVFLPSGENSPGVSGAQFLIGPQGQPTLLRLENLKQPNLKDFERRATPAK